MKFKIEHYYAVVGSLAILLPQLVEGRTKALQSETLSLQNDVTRDFNTVNDRNNYDGATKSKKSGKTKRLTLKTTAQWLTTSNPKSLTDRRELFIEKSTSNTTKHADKISEQFNSSIPCQPEDYQFFFNVSKLHAKNATFTWRQPKCIQDKQNIEFYEVILTDPDKNEFRFRFGTNITEASISDGKENLASGNGSFDFVPGTVYKAVLHAKTNDTHTFSESNTVTIVMPRDTPGVNVQIQDLILEKKGTTWIEFRWKAFSSLSDSDKHNNIRARANRIRGCYRSELLSSHDLTTIDSGTYYSYNLTQCPTGSSLTPCTTYEVWIPNEKAFLSATTLPPSIKLTIDAPNPSTLKLHWQDVPNCNDYRLLKYTLHIKANSHPASNISTDINAQCTEFTIGRESSSCGIAYTVLPCTHYDFELTPVYENYPDPVNSTTITYNTPFPSKGDYYGMDVSDHSGSQWPTFTFTLHPQCLPSVGSLKVSLNYGTSPTVVSVPKDCLTKQHVNGTTILHLGDSDCFPNFKYFRMCATRYFVRAQAILVQNTTGALGVPQEIEAKVTLAGDWIHVPRIAIKTWGADWIFATWEPPACSIDELTFKGYELALYEKDRENSPCFTTLLAETNMNLSRVINCNNRKEKVHIQPCTVYYVEVKLHFGVADLDFNASWVRSNEIRTLPQLSSLVLLNATATSLSIAWGDVAQNAYCVSSYELRVSDESAKMKIFWVANYEFAYKFTNLAPCTTYEVLISGIPRTRNEVTWKLAQYTTLELGSDIPLKTNYSYWNDTALKLTWDVPQDYAKCVHSYRVEITQTNANGIKMTIENQRTKLTSFDFCCLEFDTVYEVNVTACTFSYSCQTMPANIFINAVLMSLYLGSTGKIRPAATVAMIVLLCLCSAFLVMLAYWCYVTQRWRTCLAFCFNTKGECIRRRRPSYSRANEDDIEELGARKKSHGSKRQSLKHSLRSYVTSRPIGIQDFDKALAVLMADTCALLGEEYEDIKMLSNGHQPKTQAAQPENKAKNRYVNILPYDHSRVPLSSSHEGGSEEYINASYIQGFNGAREYIAAQGPKPVTIPDFWRMIWEQDVRVVVMVTQLEEQGRIKCAQYWPDSSQILSYGDISVSQVLQVDMDDYIIRELEVQNDGSKRIVKHMHFLKWPDFGCPENPKTLLSFVDAVRDRIFSLSAGGPILVHCSAGVGRTGTFIAVDWLVQVAQANRELDIFNTVLKLRSDRMNMVQTEDQYLFIYQCLAHFLKTRLRDERPLPLNTKESQEIPVETNELQSFPANGIMRKVSEVETNM